MHIHVFAPPSMLCRAFGWSLDGATQTNIIPVTAHPCRILLLADGALVERARRSRRADRDAPNESSVAQMRAELWPETCFCPSGALVERAGRSRRADRDAPNESSVAQLGAELWPETCFGRMCIQNVEAASMVFSELWMTIRVCFSGLLTFAYRGPWRVLPGPWLPGRPAQSTGAAPPQCPRQFSAPKTVVEAPLCSGRFSR